MIHMVTVEDGNTIKRSTVEHRGTVAFTEEGNTTRTFQAQFKKDGGFSVGIFDENGYHHIADGDIAGTWMAVNVNKDWE